MVSVPGDAVPTSRHVTLFTSSCHLPQAEMFGLHTLQWTLGASQHSSACLSRPPSSTLPVPGLFPLTLQRAPLPWLQT